MNPPLGLILAALCILAVLICVEIRRVVNYLLGNPERPMPVPNRVAAVACWLVVAVDLAAEGHWLAIVGPAFFIVATLAAGRIFEVVVRNPSRLHPVGRLR